MTGSVVIKHTVFAIDCPDPGALASFYSTLTGRPVARTGDDWAQLESDGSSALAFQLAPDYRAPQWPGQQVPQQIHPDFLVDDLDAGERFVLGIGATKPEQDTARQHAFRVYLDPVGHPFCLVTDV